MAKNIEKSKKDEVKKPTTRREESEYDKKLVEVRRVTKVVKGGRTMRFSALVVLGNGKGQVGMGIGANKQIISTASRFSQITDSSTGQRDVRKTQPAVQVTDLNNPKV